MPIYNYTCKCGNEWEEIISLKERDKVKCSCGKKAKIALSCPAIHMKGKVHKVGKDDVKRVYNEMIQESKQRLNNPISPYASYKIDPKKATEHGHVRRVSDKEASRKAEESKKWASKVRNNRDRKK